MGGVGEGKVLSSVFPFERLPVELKSLILDFLKTKFLDEVCANVCSSWRQVVTDILEIRRTNVGDYIPDWLRREIKLSVEPGLEDSSLEVLKRFECFKLDTTFNAVPVVVNSDLVKSKTGFFHHLWTLRDCECHNFATCLIRNIHLIPSLNLILIHSETTPPENLNFYHLSDLERLESSIKSSTFYKYNVTPSDSDSYCRPNRISRRISVDGNYIALDLSGKKILVLKILNVDHSTRQVILERVRFVHLPLWTTDILLTETKLMILYTTGSVGMYDRPNEELLMSNFRVDLEEANRRFWHEDKMYQLGDVTLVKAHITRTDKHRWYLIDQGLSVIPINMERLMFVLISDPGYSHVEDVAHVDIWHNCFLVRMSVRTQTDRRQKSEVHSFVFFKRIIDYPKQEDFLDDNEFGRRFFVRGAANEGVTQLRVQHRIDFTCLFVPLSLEPWQLEPKPNEMAVPVADMVGIQITPLDNRLLTPRNKVKALRVRLANIYRHRANLRTN